MTDRVIPSDVRPVRIGGLGAIAISLLVSAALATAPTASADVTCDRVASLSGSDGNSGTTSAPFRTVKKLSDSLAAGQVGCARSGEYVEDVKVTKGGVSGSPVVVRSYPGERAKITGRMWIAQGADWFTLADLDLNGRSPSLLPSPTVNAKYTSLIHNDISNENTEICVLLGSEWGRADGATVTRNRIHECGQRNPITNKDHGIYIGAASDAHISYNLIYNNADRGIQLYPDADRTRIDHNVIDGNGEGIIFSGSGATVSDNNRVEYNLVTNSTIRYNVESYYDAGAPIGTGNVVQRNCISGGARDSGNGGIISPQVGFQADGTNLHRDPGYANRGTGDFHLVAGACLDLVGDIQAAVDGDSQPGAQPPTAAFSASPNPVIAGDSVKFDASASTVEEGSQVRFEWDLDGNGTFEVDSGAGAVVTHTYATAGTVQTRLRVTDGRGGSAQATVAVTVNPPPAPQPQPTVKPTCSNISTSAVKRVTVTFYLKCTDPSGARLAYTLASKPSLGAVTSFSSSTGKVSYKSRRTGSTSFTYFATNAGGVKSDTATVAIAVGEASAATKALRSHRKPKRLKR